MILRNFKIFFYLLFLVLISTSSYGEEKIDIWQQKKEKGQTPKILETDKKIKQKNNLNISGKIESKPAIEIEDDLNNESNKVKIFGVHDPSDYDFTLNMWSSTDADDVRASIKRLKKIKLSKTSSEILENILLSFSFPPNGMDDKEFVKLKINWLIENNRSELIEDFLKQNEEFEGKGQAVQYLVDENIAKANIKEGCEKIKFIDTKIKDSYLEKFKIYCLIYNKKDSQARLLLDLLREQKQSDKFFDDKINFLLGISPKTSDKVNDKNLLNFYLSSVTIKNFKYEPSKKTKKEIWKYLNAANLIQIENINDKQKLNELELAASSGQIDESIIFNIYKQNKFDLLTLINAKNIYKTLDGIDARSLIFQKYLLSEGYSTKVEYLFILDELFKKDKISNIYSSFLSNQLKEIGTENIPKKFLELAEKKNDY